MDHRSRVASRSVARRFGWHAAAALAAAGMAIALTPAVASASSGVTGYKIVSGSSTPITPGQSVSATVSCPASKVVVSGGVSAHSPLTFVSSSWPASANSWDVVVTDTGDETYTEHFAPYAVCVDSISVPGIHIAESPSEPAGLLGPIYNPPNVGAAYAFCGSGEVSLGGGVDSSDGDTLLTISQPASGAPTGWLAYVLRTDPAPGTTYFNVYAVCVPGTDLSSYTIGSASYGSYGTFLGLLGSPPGAALTAVPPAVTNTAGAPYCGGGLVAVGGGASNHDWESGGRVSSLYPDSSGKYWLATGTEVDPPGGYNEYFLPGDICITGNMVEPTSLTAAPQLVEFVPFLGVGNQTVRATLTSGGSPVSGQLVSFSVGATPLCSATTNPAGVAQCKISAYGQLLVNRANSYTASFAGSSDYLASTASTPAVTFF